MQRLKPKHIIRNADGTEEIRIKRQKTDVEVIIPLLPIAKQILSLYIKDKTERLDIPQFHNKKDFLCMCEYRADMPNRERLDLPHGSPHILDHDLPIQWYLNGNTQQDARTQQYWHDTNLRKDNRP